MKSIFEFDRLMMNDLPYSFLLEVIFRSVVMYIVAMIVLKLAGRRGVKQLSIFEIVIIITLGSAAGDPLFYDDVGLLPAITVFIIILVLYRSTTYLISKFKRIESWLEGKPIYLIQAGEFAIHNFKKEALAQDEFFSELRIRNVDHLGQVKLAILETNGQISIFFYKEEEVKYGLPILPHNFFERNEILNSHTKYACYFCGNVEEWKQEEHHRKCFKCGESGWVIARNNVRVT